MAILLSSYPSPAVSFSVSVCLSLIMKLLESWLLLGQAVTFLASSPLSLHRLPEEPRVRIGSALVTPAPGHALKVSQAYHIVLRGNQALPAVPSQLSLALTSPFSLVIVKDDDNCMDGRAQPSPPAVFLCCSP